jgi:hypothetical protein
MYTLALLIRSAVGLGLVGVALSLFASYVLQGWRSGKQRGVVLLINTLLVAVLGAIFMSLPVELVLAFVRDTPRSNACRCWDAVTPV